ASNFAGEFTFGARPNPDPTCVPNTLNDNCVITPITAYLLTVQGLSQGLGFSQILANGGGASYYTQTTGTPASSVTVVDGGLFAQDDWKFRPNITISYGLRFETQNNLGNKVDF